MVVPFDWTTLEREADSRPPSIVQINDEAFSQITQVKGFYGTMSITEGGMFSYIEFQEVPLSFSDPFTILLDDAREFRIIAQRAGDAPLEFLIQEREGNNWLDRQELFYS